MTDTLMSKGKFLTVATWGVVVVLLVAAWVVILMTEAWLVGGMLAATGCATSALAAALMVRCYMVRTCNMIRVFNQAGGTQEPAAPLHQVL